MGNKLKKSFDFILYYKYFNNKSIFIVTNHGYYNTYHK
jgi:hypothetical protein